MAFFLIDAKLEGFRDYDKPINSSLTIIGFTLTAIALTVVYVCIVNRLSRFKQLKLKNMKNLLLTTMLFAGLLATGGLKAQQTASTDPNAPVIKFEKDTIDYGTIAHNADGYRYFRFVNTGKEPLIINEAHGSCGCTIPTPPKEPIQPGQSSEIKVHYATDRIGRFVKTVTVTSNASNPTKVVVIMGNVLPDPPATGTTVTPPANAGN